MQRTVEPLPPLWVDRVKILLRILLRDGNPAPEILSSSEATLPDLNSLEEQADIVYNDNTRYA